MPSDKLKSPGPNDARMPGNSNHASRRAWIIVSGCLLITFIAVVLPRRKIASPDRAGATNASAANGRFERAARISSAHRRLNSAAESEPAKTAEEIVAGKLAQFARSRRELGQVWPRCSGGEVFDDVTL